MKKAFYASLIAAATVTPSFAGDSAADAADSASTAAEADSVQPAADVKVEDVTRIIVDKDAQVDIKTLLAQIDAMLASNAEQTKNINKSNFKISMLQARTFEEVLYAAAQKINLQNVPEIKEQLDATKRQILVRAYISKIMGERIKEEDLKAHYNKIVKEYPKPGIELGHILVKDENTAKEVIAALDKGEKFEDVAKKYSVAASKDKGGHEDTIPLDALTPQMDEIRNLKERQYIRKPLQSRLGFHIVSVLAKKDVSAPAFEAVRKNIEGELFRVELEKLTKTLLKTINVKAYNDQGKEIDIMPLLTMQMDPASIGFGAPGAQQAASRTDAPVVAPAAAEQPKAETAPAAAESSTEASESSEEKKEAESTPAPTDEATSDEAEGEEEQGFFDKIIYWFKQLFS